MPRKPPKNNRIASDTNPHMGSALTKLINDHRKSRQEVKQTASSSGVEESFFDSCVVRMKSLPQQTRSFLQFQISQLFFNAENRDMPPVPITPLPPHQPCAHTGPPHTASVREPRQPQNVNHIPASCAQTEISGRQQSQNSDHLPASDAQTEIKHKTLPTRSSAKSDIYNGNE